MKIVTWSCLRKPVWPRSRRIAILACGAGLMVAVGLAAPIAAYAGLHAGILAAIIASGIGVLLLQRPEWFVSLVLFSAPLWSLMSGQGNLFSGTGLATDVAGALNAMLGATALWYLLVVERRYRLNELIRILPHALPYIAFLLWLAITLQWSLDPGTGVRIITRLATPFLLSLVLAAVILRGASLQSVYLAILLSVSVPLCVGSWQALNGTLLEKGLRLSSIFYHANNYAFFLYFILVLVLFADSLWSVQVKMPVRLVVTAMVVAHLLFTGTRIAWLATVVAGMIWANERHKRPWRVPLFVAGAALATFVIFKLIPTEIIAQRFAELSLGSLRDISERTDVPMGWRMVVWRYLIEQWKLASLTGTGVGSADLLVSQVVPVRYAPHNEYLRVLVEGGLVGLVLLGVTLFCLFRSSIILARGGSLGMLAATLGFALIMLTDNLLIYYNVSLYFWVVAGASLVGFRRIEAATTSTIIEGHCK